jgi:ubiquinone/menaquinone biosynthesis C-methylase UbiE
MFEILGGMNMQINAVEYDEIARGTFAPIYPVIAQQIMEKTGINRGTCLDIGCGGGYLGIALTRISELSLYLFDESQDMLRIAQQNIISESLESRAQIMEGDVHSIPINDQVIDLVVSRGSIFFWENQLRALQEIYRVLAPGGMAYIGGGFGSSELKQQIDTQMAAKDPEWAERSKQRMSRNNVDKYRKILQQAKIPYYELNKTEAGLWIIIRK